MRGRGRWTGATIAFVTGLAAGPGVAQRASMPGTPVVELSPAAPAAVPPRPCPQVEPVVIATARIPEPVWDRMPGWTARLRFRIDPADGSPRSIEASDVAQRSSRDTVDSRVLSQVAVETIGRYRFCMPADLDPERRYVARMRFTPIVARRLYVQGFEPTYVRDESNEKRTGRVVVKTTFDVTGTPLGADITTSSGDDVLDRKAAAAVMSERLVTADGRPLDQPLVFSQPFDFDIR